ARDAVAQAGIACEIVKVKDLSEIAAHGVMITPALIIDGVVVASGRVPSPDQILGHLQQES
ncbi:MAG: thioredoxin family protein, partial [Planctomycetota bacterium]